KDGSEVVVGILPSEAQKVVKQAVLMHKASLYVEGADFSLTCDQGVRYMEKSDSNVLTFDYPYPKIPICCAPAALKVLSLLKNRGIDVTQDGITKAMKRVSLPGRMQLVSYKPLIYLDVAHNPPAAVNLVNTLNNRAKLARRYAVLGMLKDKDIESVVKIIAYSFDGFYVSSLHTQRGESCERLVSALKSANVDESLVKSYSHVSEALKAAIEKANADDEIIVLGSFVTVSEAMDELKIK
ncbi:MAG: glutamate ligase domain-containing protein, partial [Succinivibrio sp.]